MTTLTELEKFMGSYRAFSHDVTAAMLVFQTNPLGIEIYFDANIFFCFITLAFTLVT